MGEIVVKKRFRGRNMYPPALYLLFARVYANFAEKVAYLHFLTPTLCPFDGVKSARSYNILQKKKRKICRFCAKLCSSLVFHTFTGQEGSGKAEIFALFDRVYSGKNMGGYKGKL